MTEVKHDTFSNLKKMDDTGTLGLFTGGAKGFSIPQKSPDRCGALSRGVGGWHLKISTRPRLVSALRMLVTMLSIPLRLYVLHKNNCMFVPHIPFHNGDFLENKAYISFLPFPFLCVYRMSNKLVLQGT